MTARAWISEATLHSSVELRKMRQWNWSATGNMSVSNIRVDRGPGSNKAEDLRRVKGPLDRLPGGATGGA
jgi:hypothetical protein